MDQDFEPDWFYSRSDPLPTMDDQERTMILEEELPEEPMKRTQSSSIICEVCRKGVRHHHGAESAFIETISVPGGPPIKRAFHIKRCWPKERKRRSKELRLAEFRRQQKFDADREIATAHRIAQEFDHHMEEEVMLPVGNKPGPNRGIGIKTYEILDSIAVGNEWTCDIIIQKLKVHGFETTKGSVQQMIWTYRQIRRDATVVRKEQVGRAHVKIYRFDEPAPTEPITMVSMESNKRSPRVHTAKEFLKQPVVEQVEPPARPLPKPAPAPGLSHADLNRAFNDFQAFLLEALMDFRNELLKMLK